MSCICGKKALWQCAGCSKAQYCSERCQQDEWAAGHKSICSLVVAGEPSMKAQAETETLGWTDVNGKPLGLQIVKELGEGSFGEVFLVVDKQKNEYALKKFKIDEDDEEEAEYQRETFRNEAEIMRLINPTDPETGKPQNEHVVSIIGFFENPGKEPMLLSEYIDGSDLDDGYYKLNDVSALPEIARGVFEGLKFLHAKGVTHRDIKPDNIRLEKGTNRVVLIDLGLACLFDDVIAEERKIQKLTCDAEEEETSGAYAYLSPGLASAFVSRMQAKKENFMRDVGVDPKPLPIISRVIWQKNDLFAAAMTIFDLVLQPTLAVSVLGLIDGIQSFANPALVFKHLSSFFNNPEMLAADNNPGIVKTGAFGRAYILWQQANDRRVDYDPDVNKTLGLMRNLVWKSFSSENDFTASKIVDDLSK